MIRSQVNYLSPRSIAILVGALALVVGAGGVIGVNNLPDAWYMALAKPPLNPPNWVFGPVWFVLYLLIAAAGWRTAVRDGLSPRLALWGGQMVLNWAWSPTWFTLHQPWAALVIIYGVLAAIIAFIVLSWRSGDRVSAWLFVPYALWVSFASYLNLSIAIRNP